ncbi:MAG: penicillin acylase family protein [Pirellulaceae bacterium]|nr:penicillin acylase family protein [Pirellulaceae bacterium]
MERTQPTAEPARLRAWHRRWSWRKVIVRSLLVGVLVLSAGTGWFYWRLRASLPILDGQVVVQGLAGPVEIARDALGVPTIVGSTRADAAFGLGFLHAQDRYFQMDLLRRMSAGRLSELFGEAAVGSDSSFRKHRFQQLAEKVLRSLPTDHARVVTAYTLGVNSGLKELGSAPFEYLLLQSEPKPWREQDCILVMMTMLCDLQEMDAQSEIALGILRERVPVEVFDFLVRKGSNWDAALDGSTLPEPSIPPAEIWSLRETGTAVPALTANSPSSGNFFESTDRSPELRVGSNNWAVSGALGRDGHAILASDMHLGLSVPAIWYRAVMTTPTINGSMHRLVGVTLPGSPLLVEGSNGSVAWGFTNSYGDFGDVIELQPVPDDTDAYLTLAGPLKIEHFSEQIDFPGGSKSCDYEWTIWGPVVENRNGRRFVHHWVGDDPEAFDLQAIAFESATTTDAAMHVANRTAMPHVNVVIADRAGNIGWTLCGRIPRRTGPPSNVPQDWSLGKGPWQGYLRPEEIPRVLNPHEGRVWTANNRVLGAEYLDIISNAGMGFDEGARAMQIRDLLRAQDSFTELDMLDIQLNDEARFLLRWQQLLLSSVTGGLPDSRSVKQEFVDLVEDWGGRASPNSVGYRLVHEFRWQIIERVFGRSQRSLNNTGTFYQKTNIQRALPLAYEDVMWQLLKERPQHWLPHTFESWDALLSDAAAGTEQKLTQKSSLASATWGARNTVSIQHPLAKAIPLLSRWLDMPVRQLPGDDHMPRVQGLTFGASQRMVVSPGREERGIYHQPGGQSGHPLSPFYRAGYEDWVAGNPSALLPGAGIHSLLLTPQKQ